MDVDGVTRSLPPLVEGKIHGYLKLIISEIVWYRLRPGDVTVLANWWGETDNAQFRPVDPTMSTKRPDPETRQTYAIRTNLELFSEYLTNCGTLDLTIVSETLNEIVGTAEVTELHEIFHRQQYTHYCSIFNKVGTKIGDIPVTMSLTMLQKAQRSPFKLKKAKPNKITLNLSDPDLYLSIEKLNSEKFTPHSARELKSREESVYRSILKDKRFKLNERQSSFAENFDKRLKINEKPSSITDNLVAQVVARAKKLRGELLKADEQNSLEINEHSIDDFENEAEEEAALYKYFMGSNLTLKDEKKALKKLRDTSPTASLIDIATETIESCRETENSKSNSQWNDRNKFNGDFSSKNNKSDNYYSSRNEIIDHTTALKNNDFEDYYEENGVTNHIHLHKKQSTPMDHVDSLRIFVSTLSLTPAGYRRVKSSCLSRNDGVTTSVTYFLQYDAGFANVKKYNKKVINQSQKPVKITSRKQDGQIIYFNHEAVYDLPRSHLHILLTSPWKFKIFHRHFDQRTPTELGIGSILIGDAAKSKYLTTTQKLAVIKKGIKIGELRVTLELGCDKIHFGKQFTEAVTMAKENIPVLELSNDFSEKSRQNSEILTSGRNFGSNGNKRSNYTLKSAETDRNPQHYTPTDKNITSKSKTGYLTHTITRNSVGKVDEKSAVRMNYVSRESSRKSAELIDDTLKKSAFKSDSTEFFNEKILLHGLIYISKGRYFNSVDTYIVCRALWKENRTSSKVCYNTTNPSYNLHQIIPLIYGSELLERTRDNCIVVEVYLKNPSGEDELVGIAKLPVHELYVAFKEPTIVGSQLRARFPVLSVDGWVPVTNPVNGRLCGEILATVALGTADQIALFEMTRGFKPREEDGFFDKKSKIGRREQIYEEDEPIPLRTSTIHARKEPIPLRENQIHFQEELPILKRNDSINRQKEPIFPEKETIFEAHHISHHKKPIYSQTEPPISQRKTPMFYRNSPIYEEDLTTDEEEPILQGRNTTFHLDEPISPGRTPIYHDLQPISSKTTQVCQTEISTFSNPLQKLMPEHSHGLSSPSLGPRMELHIAEVHKEDDDEINTTAILSSNSNSFSDDSEQRFEMSRGMYRSVGVGAEFSEPEPKSTQNTDYNTASDQIQQSNSPKHEESVSESDPPPEVRVGEKPTDEGENEDGFRVVIEIECALHLPTIDLPDAPVEPSTYVTFQHLFGDERTEVFPYSCSPKYDFRCDTKLPTELLTNDQMRLIMKVWRLVDAETSTEINLERDVVIGFSAIDISVLTAGFPVISGWFHINDFGGKPNGQLKVSVTPLDDISSFSRLVTSTVHSHPENRSMLSSPFSQELVPESSSKGLPPSSVSEESREAVGTSAGLGFDFGFGEASMSFLSTSLKHKLTELDEIKERLQSRLRDVTNNAFEEDFENDFDFFDPDFDNDDDNGNSEVKKLESNKPPERPSNRITNGNGEVIGEIETNRPSSENKTASPEPHLTDTGYSSGSNVPSATKGHRTPECSTVSHETPINPSNGRKPIEFPPIPHRGVTHNHAARGTRMHISYLLDQLSTQLTAVPEPIADFPMQQNIMELINTLRRGNNFSNDFKCHRQANYRTVPTQTETHVSEIKRNKSNEEDHKDEIPAKTQKISTIVREELIAEDQNDSSEYDDLSAHLMTANVRHMSSGEAINPLLYRHTIPDVPSVPESISPSLTPEDDAIQRLDSRYSETFSATINKSLGRLKTFLEGEGSRLSPSESSELYRGSFSGIPDNTDGNIDVTVIHKPCNDDVMASNSIDSTTVSVDMQSGTDDNSSLIFTEPSVSGVSRQAPDGGNPAEDPARPIVGKDVEQSDDSSTIS